MTVTWENEIGTGQRWSAARSLTHSLDHREEGLAMQATHHCSVAGCDRPCRNRGLCGMHYQRFMKTGSTDPRPEHRTPACAMVGCEKPARGRGWCKTHWARWRKHGDPMVVLVGSAASPGTQNCKWQGDEIGYGRAHERVRAARGPASSQRCADCGQGAENWSYDHRDPDERIEPNDPKRKPYSVKVEHYQPRCGPCHWKVDHPTGKVTRS
jgi:hypothetical protein